MNAFREFSVKLSEASKVNPQLLIQVRNQNTNIMRQYSYNHEIKSNRKLKAQLLILHLQWDCYTINQPIKSINQSQNFLSSIIIIMYQASVYSHFRVRTIFGNHVRDSLFLKIHWSVQKWLVPAKEGMQSKSGVF